MTEADRKQRGIDAQRKPPTTQAFTCSNCHQPHKTEADARECCACEGCGLKFPHRSSDRDYWCGHCQRPRTLKYLREEIGRDEVRARQAQATLDHNRKRLAEIEAAPRPPKGAAPEKL